MLHGRNKEYWFPQIVDTDRLDLTRMIYALGFRGSCRIPMAVTRSSTDVILVFPYPPRMSHGSRTREDIDNNITCDLGDDA